MQNSLEDSLLPRAHRLSFVNRNKPLLWSLFTSILVHTVGLTLSLLALKASSQPSLPVKIGLIEPAPARPDARVESPPERASKTAAPRSISARSITRQPRTSGVSPAESPTPEGIQGGEPGPGGESEGMTVPDGGVASEGWGVAAGLGGTWGGAGGTSPAAVGKGSGGSGGFATGEGSRGRDKKTPGGTDSFSPDSLIPELPQSYYRYRGGTYFVDVDHYLLDGKSIPATNLCVDGDRLRTRVPITMTQLKTDHSQCRVIQRGDETKEICPPQSRSEEVVFEGHVSAPLSYTVNTCLEYDKSHCRIKGLGTDREQEFCKVNFKYEGIWAPGTIYDYRCISSERITQQYPLQYNIRYMVDVERNERIISREIHRITQTIPHCAGEKINHMPIERDTAPVYGLISGRSAFRCIFRF
jgi:hypothetical protein